MFEELEGRKPLYTPEEWARRARVHADRLAALCGGKEVTLCEGKIGRLPTVVMEPK